MELDEVGDLRGLWSGVEKAAVIRDKLTVPEEGVYRLEASAKLRAEANGNASDEMRQWRALDYDEAKSLDPRAVLYEHALVKNAVLLTRGKDSHDFDDAVE